MGRHGRGRVGIVRSAALQITQPTEHQPRLGVSRRSLRPTCGMTDGGVVGPNQYVIEGFLLQMEER